MDNNTDNNVNSSNVEKKRKGHGPIYWLIVVVGVAFIVAASFNLGTKFGKMVEGNDTNTTNNSNEVSNSNQTSNLESNVNSDVNSNSNSNILSDEEALKIGNEQWDYAASALFCGKYNYNENDKDANGSVAITNFDEVNSHFTTDSLVGSDLNSMKSFKEYATGGLTYANGKYYDPSQCGRGSNITYMNTSLKLVDKKENEIKFTATSTYCSTPPTSNTCSGQTSTKDAEFIIRKENNTWKIVKFYLPY